MTLPMYNFRCGVCGHVFERLVPFDTRIAHCPECHEPAERQPSAPAFTIGGWNAANGYAGVKPRG